MIAGSLTGSLAVLCHRRGGAAMYFLPSWQVLDGKVGESIG